MRISLAVLGVVVALLMGASPAVAGWSAPQRVVTTPGAQATAIATDGSGDTAVAWATCGNRVCGSYVHSRVYVTVRLANGHL